MKSLTEFAKEFKHHFEGNVHTPTFCPKCRLEVWLKKADMATVEEDYDSVRVEWVRREMLGTMR